MLLFVEPLSNLDARLRVQVRTEPRRLQRQLGTTSLFVTHDQDEAMSMSDRIAVMKSGKIEQIGAPDEIYSKPATLFVAQFVGKVNPLAARVTGEEAGALQIEALGQSFTVPKPSAKIEREMLALSRPETVSLTAPGAGALSGRVEEIEYLGALNEYRVRVGDQVITAVRAGLGAASRIAEGDAVGLAFNASTIHLVAAEPALAA